MATTNINSNELQELRARIAALETIVGARQQAEASAGSGGGDGLLRPSRRVWLGLLAAAGLGSAVDAAAPNEAAVSKDGGWKTYSPKLTAEKMDPVLGDGVDPKNAWMKSGQNGHYWRSGNTVVVKTWHQFAIGAHPGLGHYRLSLPVKAALGSDAWLGPTGVALMHCHATKVNRTAVVVLPHAEFVVFQIDNVAKNVGHDHPWEWAKGDGLNTFMIYEAADS